MPPSTFPPSLSLSLARNSRLFPPKTTVKVHECDEVESKPISLITSSSFPYVCPVRVSPTEGALTSLSSVVDPNETAPATPDPSSSLHTRKHFANFPTQQPPSWIRQSWQRCSSQCALVSYPPDQMYLENIICDSGKGWLTSPSALRVSIALRVLPRLPSTGPYILGHSYYINRVVGIYNGYLLIWVNQ